MQSKQHRYLFTYQIEGLKLSRKYNVFTHFSRLLKILITTVSYSSFLHNAEMVNTMTNWVNYADKGFVISGWRVEPATDRIIRGNEVIQLEPKTMEVLKYMVLRPGQVVSRQELETEVWHGRVVSYDAVTNSIVKLRKAFNDSAKKPQVIETLSKKGYRLVAQVEFPDPATGQGVNAQKKYINIFNLKISHAALLAALVFIVVLGITIWHSGDDKLFDRNVPQTIAVLPFDNLSKDPEQDYFTDGITDNLIIALAKNPELLVIARDSSFYYKKTPFNLQKIAKKLNVHFILHGNARRYDDGKLTLNVMLVEVKSGKHIWVQNYNRTSGNIFEIEKDVTQKVLSKLIFNMSTGARQDLGHTGTKNAKAYNNFLHGRQIFYKYLNKSENNKARQLFQQAIKYDKNFAIAHAMLAWTHVFDVMNGWSDNRKKSLQMATLSAEKATSLQIALPLAYFVTGLVYRENGEYIKALVEVEKAVHYDPNYANAQVLYATLLYYAGSPQEGLERIQKAIKLNPHHPHNYTFHLGQAYYVLGQYENAIKTLKEGIKSIPTSERLHVWLAAAYAQNGQMKEADWEAVQVFSLNPDFSLQRLRTTYPFKKQADLDHFIKGLIKAGLFEESD